MQHKILSLDDDGSNRVKNMRNLGNRNVVSSVDEISTDYIVTKIDMVRMLN